MSTARSSRVPFIASVMRCATLSDAIFWTVDSRTLSVGGLLLFARHGSSLSSASSSCRADLEQWRVGLRRRRVGAAARRGRRRTRASRSTRRSARETLRATRAESSRGSHRRPTRSRDRDRRRAASAARAARARAAPCRPAPPARRMSRATSPRRKKSRSGVRRPGSGTPVSAYLQRPEQDHGRDEHDRAEDHHHTGVEPPFAAQPVVDEHVRAADGDGVVRELRQEVADGLFGVDANLRGIRTDERTREDSAGQPRDIVALECLERADRNLGRLGNLTQARRRAAREPASSASRNRPRTP